MVRSTQFLLWCAYVSVLCTTACRTATDYPQPDAALDDAAVADSGPPDTGPEVDEPYTEPLAAGEWSGMDFEARRKFMREMVMPAMRQAFQDFDAVRFASVSCRTCHGAGAMDGSFAMPAADLPVLNNAALMNPEEAQRPMIEFMRMVVRPQLASLLGAEAGTPAAVRCSTCHVMQ